MSTAHDVTHPATKPLSRMKDIITMALKNKKFAAGVDWNQMARDVDELARNLQVEQTGQQNKEVPLQIHLGTNLNVGKYGAVIRFDGLEISGAFQELDEVYSFINQTIQSVETQEKA